MKKCCLLFSAVLFSCTNIMTITFYKLSACTNKNNIIQAALALELPVTDTINSEEAHKIDTQAIQRVHEGNYEEAINIMLSGLRTFPKNFVLQADLASLLGDCAEITPSPLKELMIERSKQLFDRLMNELTGKPKADVYDFKNEYYFRFALYHQQYEVGRSRVKEHWGTDEWESAKGFRGYHHQGVGAVYYAKKLLIEGNRPQALEYAQKSLVAWAQYFTYTNDYYNPYVHYALALGILGCKEEMMQALNRSASLIKKDLSYHEFKEVIDFISSQEKIVS